MYRTNTGGFVILATIVAQACGQSAMEAVKARIVQRHLTVRISSLK
jgi:hypothetical protein